MGVAVAPFAKAGVAGNSVMAAAVMIAIALVKLLDMLVFSLGLSVLKKTLQREGRTLSPAGPALSKASQPDSHARKF
jgi:sulfite exporter TauE/SafE